MFITPETHGIFDYLYIFEIGRENDQKIKKNILHQTVGIQESVLDHSTSPVLVRFKFHDSWVCTILHDLGLFHDYKFIIEQLEIN